jgi:hypothetical protein
MDYNGQLHDRSFQTRYPLNTRLGWPQEGLHVLEKKMLWLPGLVPRIIQCIALSQ